MALNLSRNSLLYVSTADSSFSNSNTWEIPLQDGFSFSQQMSNTDITVSEAGPTPTRGSKRFNDSLDPVDWSFATYLRPYTTGSGGAKLHQILGWVLWQALSTPAIKASGWQSADPTKPTASAYEVKFTSNQVHELAELKFYFKVDNTWYKVSGVRVNQAEISVDIEDIAMVNWSGQGTKLETLGSAPDMASVTKISGNSSNWQDISYIKNKLTVMTLSSDVSGGSVNYDIPITSASVTINNNITFLTPSTLAEVDEPIGSFTGSFDVNGSFDCYLNTKVNGSQAFMSHMQTSRAITPTGNFVLKIGGSAAPFVEITIPRAVLSVPDISIEDVVSSSVEFKGIPTDLSAGDETSLKFVAKTS